MHAEFWWGKLRKAVDVCLDARMILKGNLKKCVWRACIGLIWLRIWASGGFLWTR